MSSCKKILVKLLIALESTVEMILYGVIILLHGRLYRVDETLRSTKVSRLNSIVVDKGRLAC